ncbi:hypothetical protein [Streptomyces bobili]
MTDYTPAEQTAADDLLNQMLTATHTELLTTIATEQAGTTDNPPFVPRYRHRWLSDLYDLSDRRIDCAEENVKVAKLVELLEQIETLLNHLSMVSEDMFVATRAKMLRLKLRVLINGLILRTTSKSHLLNALEGVADVADWSLDSALIDFEVQNCGEHLKALLPQAYEGVRYLFDPSDDTESCPVS